MVGSLK